MNNVYGPDIENQMQQLYESFNEKDRRRYAAIEAYKLGHGGVGYIADLFGCHPDTIAQGRRDLENLPADEAAGRVRKKGAAAKMLAKANHHLFFKRPPKIQCQVGPGLRATDLLERRR